MLEKAKENVGKYVDHVRFWREDAQNLDFENETFDVIISRNLTWNLEEPARAYAEWMRVLKPGGKLLNFDANWYGYLYDDNKREAYEEDRKNVESAALDDHYTCTDIDRMEQIALQMPLSAIHRPVWDAKVLRSIGFTEIAIDQEIWKTVWSEYVPKISLASVKMTPDLQNAALKLEYEVAAAEKDLDDDLMITATVSFRGTTVAKQCVLANQKHVETTINVAYEGTVGLEWGVRVWTPAEPDLYDIDFAVTHKGEIVDTVGSYFAMREIRIDGPNILLNGHPLYQRLILDQGYWKDSHLTPPSEEALVEDIDKIHALGYNGLRKHQKTEDERFLYWCDVKGMLVWSEMAAAYRYTDYAVEEFTKEWMEIVRQNYNHPCIITWTPMNESWGVSQIETRKVEQHFTEAVYYLTKSLDTMRPVIVNDGWEHTVSDIITLHDYEEVGDTLYKRYTEYKDQILTTEVYHSGKSALANGYEYKGQPIIISEYGGIAFNNDDSGWGYGNKVNTKEDFIKRFDDITTAVKKIPYCCGFCYTQVSDVQQEINGLMDMERNFKVEPEIIKEINERKVGYWRTFM